MFLINFLSFGQEYSEIIPDNQIINFLQWEIKNTEKHSQEPCLAFRRRVNRIVFDWNIENFEKKGTKSQYYYEYLFSEKNNIDTLFDRKNLKAQFFSIKKKHGQLR